jgi:hypothetical protein
MWNLPLQRAGQKWIGGGPAIPRHERPRIPINAINTNG